MNDNNTESTLENWKAEALYLREKLTTSKTLVKELGKELKYVRELIEQQKLHRVDHSDKTYSDYLNRIDEALAKIKERE